MPEHHGPKAKTVVYVDLDTKRVLGFGPEGLKPMIPSNVRYEVKTPFDAIELDKWVDRYGQEMRTDQAEKNYRQFLREQPARKAIQEAIRARNNHLDPLNRDLNNAFMLMQDKRYKQMLDAKANAEFFLVAQGYDQSVSGEDLALKNPNVRTE